MLGRLLGKGTTPHTLRGGLDETTRGLRGIAHRVANASTPGAASFQDQLGRAGVGEDAPSLEDEMVRLADGQLRFEAESRMLQKIYQQIRTSVGGGGR